jgi:hypothetical protein
MPNNKEGAARYLDADCLKYIVACYPDATPEEQRSIRATFYAGACAMMEGMLAGLKPESMHTAALDELEKIGAQVEADFAAAEGKT